MANTTNYNWETPDDTDLVKDGASAIRTLGTAIDTTVFNNAGAAIAKTLVDAKGDLITATAADTPARLAVGTNGYTLVADSAEATGLKWAAPAGGGMTLLSTTTLSGATTTISVSPTGYIDLEIQWQGIDCGGNNAQFEVDAFSAFRLLEAENTNGTRNEFTNVNATMYLNGQNANSGSGTTNSGRIRLYDVNSTIAKTGEMVFYFDRSNAPTLATYAFAYNSTAAIANVYFKTNSTFSAGTVKIYGVK
jgi:hypothetical protein